jgi:hypothetical protein
MHKKLLRQARAKLERLKRKDRAKYERAEKRLKKFVRSL